MSAEKRSSTTETGNLPLSFSVRGAPKSQGSKSPQRNQHTPRIHLVENVKGLKDWRLDVKAAAEKVWPYPPTDVPISVALHFQFIRPKSVSPKKRPFYSINPDVDKLARAILDALTKVIFVDDRQVVFLTATKAYAEYEGVYIDISETKGHPVIFDLGDREVQL